MTSQPAEPQTIGRLLRIAEVERETSLHRATIYRRIARGEFPAPIKIGGPRVAWSETEVNAWKSSQIQAQAA
jgi:prophage regulatory protein